VIVELTCDVCKKTFSSHNKRDEHYKSKSHLAAEKSHKENSATEKETKPVIYTNEDNTICLFCNQKSSSLDENILHMVRIHKFEVPFPQYIKNLKEVIKVIIQKLFDYGACLSCDLQGFKNYKSLQNHMVDKDHTYINLEDLDEFLYKYYEKKSILAITDKNIRKTKEFQILKVKLSRKKKEDKADEGSWEVVSDENDDKADSDEDYDDNVVLPNGELLTSNGNVYVFFKLDLVIKIMHFIINKVLE
jgi:pre-60S factor REI1